MTNKDLNLALDQNLIQPASSPNKASHGYSSHNHGAGDDRNQTDREAENLKPTTPPPSMHPNQSKQAKKKTQNLPPYLPAWLAGAAQQPFVWLPTLLLLTNLFFLLIAGLWLSHQNQQPGTNTAIRTMVEQDIQANIEPIQNQLLNLQQQLDQITVSLHEQQRLIATSSQDLNTDIQNVAQQVQAFNASKPNTKNTVNPKETKTITPAKDWHVNLGTFSTKDAAQRLQKKLLALGHSVQINTTSFDNKTAYRVQLPGFPDRDSAENVARRIMDETNLNGLWAWKDE